MRNIEVNKFYKHKFKLSYLCLQKRISKRLIIELKRKLIRLNVTRFYVKELGKYKRIYNYYDLRPIQTLNSPEHHQWFVHIDFDDVIIEDKDFIYGKFI